MFMDMSLKALTDKKYDEVFPNEIKENNSYIDNILNQEKDNKEYITINDKLIDLKSFKDFHELKETFMQPYLSAITEGNGEKKKNSQSI